MTAWDPCSVCGQPTASGLLVCYRCAARLIAEAKSRPAERVVVDGRKLDVPPEVAAKHGLTGDVCPACAQPPMQLRKNELVCLSCGWRESET